MIEGDLSEAPRPGDPSIPREAIVEARTLRALKVGAAVVAVVVLAILGAALMLTLQAFTSQIDKAIPAVSQRGSAAKGHDLAAAPADAASAAEASGSSPRPLSVIVTAVETGTSPASPPAPVDMASIAISMAAVATVLVIALTALSMALLRSAFGLDSLHRRDSGDSDRPPAPTKAGAPGSGNGKD
jgi:hypothetical protein